MLEYVKYTKDKNPIYRPSSVIFPYSLWSLFYARKKPDGGFNNPKDIITTLNRSEFLLNPFGQKHRKCNKTAIESNQKILAQPDKGGPIDPISIFGKVAGQGSLGGGKTGWTTKITIKTKAFINPEKNNYDI